MSPKNISKEGYNHLQPLWEEMLHFFDKPNPSRIFSASCNGLNGLSSECTDANVCNSSSFPQISMYLFEKHRRHHCFHPSTTSSVDNPRHAHVHHPTLNGLPLQAWSHALCRVQHISTLLLRSRAMPNLYDIVPISMLFGKRLSIWKERMQENNNASTPFHLTNYERPKWYNGRTMG